MWFNKKRINIYNSAFFSLYSLLRRPPIVIIVKWRLPAVVIMVGIFKWLIGFVPQAPDFNLLFPTFLRSQWNSKWQTRLHGRTWIQERILLFDMRRSFARKKQCFGQVQRNVSKFLSYFMFRYVRKLRKYMPNICRTSLKAKY